MRQREHARKKKMYWWLSETFYKEREGEREPERVREQEGMRVRLCKDRPSERITYRATLFKGLSEDTFSPTPVLLCALTLPKPPLLANFISKYFHIESWLSNIEVIFFLVGGGQL